MDINQKEEVAIAMARVIQMTLAWEEALNGDDIEDLVKTFVEELNQFNGESVGVKFYAKEDEND